MSEARILLDRSQLEQRLSSLGSVSLGLIDIDNFLDLNNDYGHSSGDEVLRNLEKVLLGSVPTEALVARIGGDEYAVALPDAPAENALILLEEIRSHFSSRQVSASVPRKVHLSIGIASRPAHAETVAELFHAASEALYRAKREGRGRVAIYIESKMTLKSNYYPKASLEKLSKLSNALNKTEASLLREALEELFIKHSDQL
jgi:diguanylate cyclase (GGDEF)-like protein